MGASLEHQLICKIVETSDFHTVEKLKIDESFFLSDSILKEVFRFLSTHYHNEHTYGSIPSWQIVQDRFPGLAWAGSNDVLPTLCQELRRNKMRVELMNLMEEASTMINVDPKAAMDAVRDHISRMTSEHEVSSDILLSGAYEKLQAEYDSLATAGGITGIPYPWDILNDDTQGIHPGQLIILYGRPKNLKTWVGLYIAAHAYMKGMRVLIWSLEMSSMQILRRIACIIARVDYDKFKKAKLDPASRDRVWEILRAIKDEEFARGVSDGHTPALMATQPNGNTGVSGLQAKMREFTPDLVMVDGLYLMKDDRSKQHTVDWKSIAHISQDLKRTATQFNTPILGITQANRQAEKDPRKADLMELAYADALAQDCDLCMRVYKQVDQSSKELELAISIAGGRETTLDGFVIHGCPATNFTFKRANLMDAGANGTGGHGNEGGGTGGSGHTTTISKADGVIPINKNKPTPAAILPGWGRK